MRRIVLVVGLFGLFGCSSRQADPPADVPRPALSVGPHCAPGFQRTERGCAAIGAIACARGTFALPGETICHPTSTCADVTGAIYVDASAMPGGDGSTARPLRTIGDAIAVASPDAMIAVRAGKYAENIVLRKPVTIAGVCAERVSVEGVRTDMAAIEVRTTAKLRGLSVSGPERGIVVRDGDAELDALWIHDTSHIGLTVDVSTTKIGRVILRGSLIESAKIAGVAAFGAEATIERSAIRDTRMLAGQGGAGVLSQFYRGIAPRVLVTGSLVEKCHEAGIGVAGGSLEVINTLVRNVAPMANGTVGNGILASYDKTSGTVPSLRVSGSVIESTHEIGIALNKGEGTIEDTTVAIVLPSPKNKLYGVGIQAEPTTKLTVRDSMVLETHHIGIGFFGATGRVQGTMVSASNSTGIAISDAEGVRSMVEVTRTIVEGSGFVGVLVAGSDATLSTSEIRNTRSREGRFGDGLVGLKTDLGVASITATELTIEGNARAGIAMFGSALRLSSSYLTCNAFDLDVEDLRGPVTLTDEGENFCGCGQLTTCRASPNSLEVTPAPTRG